MPSIDQIHNQFAVALLVAATADLFGNTAEAETIRADAEEDYQSAIGKVRMGVLSRHRAECHHAQAAGDPIIKGGQGRSDAEALDHAGSLWIVGATIVVACLVAGGIYALASFLRNGG